VAYAAMGLGLSALVAGLAYVATEIVVRSGVLPRTPFAVYLGHGLIWPAILLAFALAGGTWQDFRVWQAEARRFVLRTLRRSQGYARRLLQKTVPRLAVQRRQWRANDLADRAIAWRPDVVHAHDITTLAAGARVRAETGAFLVFDAHEIYEEVAQAPKGVRKAYREIMQRWQGTVDGFVTINDSIAGFYREKYPALPQATIVKNATRHAPPFDYDGCLHDAAGLPRDQKIALYQGGFSEKRGLRTIVAAAADFDPSWTLVMMGWGPLESELRHIAERLVSRHERGADRPAVAFVPPAKPDELVRWTAGGAVGLIPYERVGLNHLYCTPNKLWEYPNARVPIVCSDLVELRKTVLENQIGWLLPPDADAQGVADTLNRLTDADLVHARGRCAEFMRRDNFDVYSERLIALFQEIAPQQDEGAQGIDLQTARISDAVAAN
jgi:glycosyltransferase involved in cell wall biosynthesis